MSFDPPTYKPHGRHGNKVDDDGGTIIVLDSEDQSLWFREGMVFHSYPRTYVDNGLWVEYQAKHYASPMQGPFLFDWATFEMLYKRLKKRHQWYMKRSRVSAKTREEWRRKTWEAIEERASKMWGYALQKP